MRMKLLSIALVAACLMPFAGIAHAGTRARHDGHDQNGER